MPHKVLALKQSDRIRKDGERIAIQEVFEAIDKSLKRGYFRFRGILYAYSKRLVCFRNRGCTCRACGRKALFFILEKNTNAKTYHLALYSLNERGEEVLMTRDHTVPLSRGGSDSLNNSECYCYPCNLKKGSS